MLISVKLVPDWFGLQTENASLSIEFSKIKQQSDLRHLNQQLPFHALVFSFIGKVEKQNKAMKMFCNKRFLEAGKLMMFRDVRAVGAGGLGEEQGPHPDFVSTRGLIMPTILIHSPPDFQTFLRLWTLFGGTCI